MEMFKMPTQRPELITIISLAKIRIHASYMHKFDKQESLQLKTNLVHPLESLPTVL
jgi:hypothetical protein